MDQLIFIIIFFNCDQPSVRGSCAVAMWRGFTVAEIFQVPFSEFSDILSVPGLPESLSLNDHVVYSQQCDFSFSVQVSQCRMREAEQSCG